ncbi:MAG: hypothetical protein H7X86_03115 [Gorillibacterium sp.]|nr:hypothetical protein [Gorillibacterium sp.]
MSKNQDKGLYIITLIIVFLSLLTTSIGLFYTTGGEAYSFMNQYGDIVKMYGDGLYAYDSYFVAPIFRGTDFTMLCLAIPLLITALVLDIKKRQLKNRIFLMSVMAVFTYYSASIAFGITYNILHLAYIALFSASLFGLIMAFRSIDEKRVADRMGNGLPSKGVNIFLVITGIALIMVWLPDILTSLAAGRSLALIEVYTTSVTNVIDMGVIAPVAFISYSQLKKRNGMGYILLGMLLTVCCVFGIMLPVQTLFQELAGIDLPPAVVIVKVASFVVLGFFALYFNVKFYKDMK